MKKQSMKDKMHESKGMKKEMGKKKAFDPEEDKGYVVDSHRASMQKTMKKKK